MIIDNTYFKNDIYIPLAKPSVNSAFAESDSDFAQFIKQKEAECLRLCLGDTLARELYSRIDTNEPNYIVGGANDEWDALLNGFEYTINGKSKFWKGIRYAPILSGDAPSVSFIAFYIYFYFQQNNWIKTSQLGDQIEKTENSESVPPTFNAVKAWNNFVDLVQGNYEVRPRVYASVKGIGLDYWNGDKEDVSLYKFLEDQFTLNGYFESKRNKQFKRLDILNLV